MIKSLTSLRGIFILFIFFHHCLSLYPGGGTMAVAFFFILSGFGLTLGYKDRLLNRDFHYRQFLVRRCIKFYPLHWLCLLAMLPLTGLPQTLKQMAILVANASLLQTIVPLRVLYFSYNAPSWYLANTLLFAVAFPPIVKLILRSQFKGRLIITTAFVLFFITVAVLTPKDWYHNLLYISPFLRLGDFLLGIFLALFYVQLKEENAPANLRFLDNRPWGTIIVIALIALLVLESCLLEKPVNFIAPLYWPITALLILTTAFIDGKSRVFNNPFLYRVGELSFIIFLTHAPVLFYTTKVFQHLNIESPVLYILLTLSLTLAVSAALDRFILKPLTQWLTQNFLASTTALS